MYFLAGGPIVLRDAPACVADVQLLACHPYLFQMFEQLLWHAFRQIERTVIIEYLDAADIFRLEPGLVGDGPDDIGRLDAMYVADLDAECLHADIGLAIIGFAIGALLPWLRELFLRRTSTKCGLHCPVVDPIVCFADGRRGLAARRFADSGALAMADA